MGWDSTSFAAPGAFHVGSRSGASAEDVDATLVVGIGDGGRTDAIFLGDVQSRFTRGLEGSFVVEDVNGVEVRRAEVEGAAPKKFMLTAFCVDLARSK